MTTSITLPIWPTSLDCIAWSKDNHIAVAGGEQIAVLTPRLKEPGPDGTYWNHTIFKANAFTADEIPLADPLSFKNLSLGEELSQRSVHALAWSSPGLARYGRCVLAVLSSNHVLSIWECDGKPDITASWKRSVVVNHVLCRHYGMNEGEDLETFERKQVQQRIRAFAWSPPLFKGDDEVSRRVGQSDQFLAVSTEAGDILILRVRSPYDVLNPVTTEWSLEFVCSLNFRALILRVVYPGLSEAEQAQQINPECTFIADYLACSDWLGGKASLAFIIGKRLYYVELTGEDDGMSVAAIHDIKQVALSRADMTGPLQFVPRTTSVVAFAADSVYYIDTSAPNPDVSLASHHLDGRWDEVSGFAFSTSDTELPQVHTTSHLSTAPAVTTTLALPLDSSAASIPPSWQAAIRKSKAAFSAQQNLNGNVQERVWGIAASPCGQDIATASTLLPSDTIAYLIPSDHRTVVNITREHTSIDQLQRLAGSIRFQPELHAECLLFTLQRYVESQSGPVSKENLVETIAKAASLRGDVSEFQQDSDAVSDPTQRAAILRMLRSGMFLNPALMRERSKLLVDYALRETPSINHISKLVLEQLLRTFLRLSKASLQGGPLSKSICKIYDLLQAKLGLQRESAEPESGVVHFKEECSICKMAVPFESIKWARCEKGHQFSRCGLTFLAIQKPGLSKHCTICRTEFLNESYIPELELSTGEDDVDMVDILDNDESLQENLTADVPAHPLNGQASESGWVQVSKNDAGPTEPTASFARMLFAAFDACIYCGGKFVA